MEAGRYPDSQGGLGVGRPGSSTVSLFVGEWPFVGPSHEKGLQGAVFPWSEDDSWILLSSSPHLGS
jgi:hypothetical protein